jgi:uncharacterized damage-inducible protein DinB
MTSDDLRTILLRDLDALVRELEAYPDEADIWAMPEGVPNSAGTLALHMAGNLHHYIGAAIGGAAYVRDRDAEFGDRDVPRAVILEKIAAARQAIDATLSDLDAASLAAPFPGELPFGELRTGRFLTHLAVHCGYHLGQVDYHRRIVTGRGDSVDALSLRAMS